MYDATIWKDRIVEKPKTYTIQENGDGTVTLVPAPGVVTEEGTPVNATNLNKLEQAVKTHEAESATLNKLGHIKLSEIPTSATTLDIQNGTDNTKMITPKNAKDVIYARPGNTPCVFCYHDTNFSIKNNLSMSKSSVADGGEFEVVYPSPLVPCDGVYRISFEMYHNGGGVAGLCIAQNGVVVSPIKTTSSASAVAFSMDVPLVEGFPLQIMLSNSLNSGTARTWVNNFVVSTSKGLFVFVV